LSLHITIRIAVRAVRIFPARPRPKMARFDRSRSFFKFVLSLELRNKWNKLIFLAPCHHFYIANAFKIFNYQRNWFISHYFIKKFHNKLVYSR
jgi:hypothetical protein